MKRSFIIFGLLVLMAGIVFAVSGEAQPNADAKRSAQRTEQREARQQRRAERLAAYERYVDSLVMSQNFRFVPQTMQQMPAGIMRNLQNPHYEVAVWGPSVDVCIPFLKGYVPPYYPVVFNYVLPSVDGYTTEQTNDGWNVTFSTTLFSASDYTFNFEIYSRYGGATLTISSPFYNSVQYTGSIFAI